MNMAKPIYDAIVGAHRGHKWYGSKLGSGCFSIRYGIKGKKSGHFQAPFTENLNVRFFNYHAPKFPYVL